MPRTRHALLAVLLVSCESGPAPDLELELGRFCDRVAFEVRDPAVLPGWTVHALALERSDDERAWALATDPEGRLKLVAAPDGEAHDFSDIGDVDDLQLVPGAVDGQTWVLLGRASEAQVWRVRDGVLQAGPRMQDFPEAGTWTRRLVFLDGAAHILSVPTSGDALTVEVLLSRLDDALAPAPAQRLPLWECEDAGGSEPMPVCQPPLVFGAVDLELLATTEGGSITGVAALIAMYSAYEPDPPATPLYSTLVTNIELRSLGPEAPPTMVRHDLPYWATTGPVTVTPASIAADDGALYWLAGIRPEMADPSYPEQDFVYRVPRDDSAGGRIMATAKKELASQLLQVGGQVGLSQLAGDVWKLAPLTVQGVNVGLTGTLPLDPGTRVSSAGRGQFLLRSDSGARRVAVRCASE